MSFDVKLTAPAVQPDARTVNPGQEVGYRGALNAGPLHRDALSEDEACGLRSAIASARADASMSDARCDELDRVVRRLTVSSLAERGGVYPLSVPRQLFDPGPRIRREQELTSHPLRAPIVDHDPGDEDRQ